MCVPSGEMATTGAAVENDWPCGTVKGNRVMVGGSVDGLKLHDTAPVRPATIAEAAAIGMARFHSGDTGRRSAAAVAEVPRLFCSSITNKAVAMSATRRVRSFSRQRLTSVQ